MVPYDSIDDAAEKAAGLIADPARLDRIAAAGHARTIRDHTYAQRAVQLAGILDARLPSAL